MKTEPHGIIHQSLHRLVSPAVLPHPGLQHSLALPQRLRPNKVIILLGERRARQPPLMPPCVAFGRHHVFPIDIHRAVNMYRFGEIVPPIRDLKYDVWVRSPQRIGPRGHRQERVGSQPLERLIMVLPGEVWTEEVNP